ncbi:urea carboxylase [Guyparkeria hydrothermalis]|uniref:urea carboxylase n=1 Tax=Guyparkeria hydrothermalis TaxID=923 RepID=UPI0020212D20|nr:urea carboxylase [Guyparkeria hydrothermalis]MCL7743585.1 urea carboxylase [Guyparkeria hydrothermalis]
MFDKVLIANRGAIACRIIRTLKRLGVRSVAVYSEQDRHALHVRQADEAVCIGEASAASSYLNAERILEVARETGAQAVHPGYGFLSENAAFAEACEAAGIAFIGPTPRQMREFGLKHTARALAEAADVPMLPGTGLLDDVEQAKAEAERIGYPVMLKSTAGGGGIGMRLCENAAELEEAFESVRRLSQSNFSDSGIFLEKFVRHARHVEVQLFGDGKGQVIALGERDCSLQRRNQKVVEETPAPNLTPEVREELQRAAEALGRGVNYRSAGTVEYILDDDTGRFYFLEVNTRLQVEHGVTEEVTGVDLVEWMVRGAADDLPDLETLRPAGVDGHSIQVRLYAEDPGKNFQPSTGLLTEVSWPADTRIETWVESGTEISPFYDPMVTKLIVHAPDREAAIAKLREALDHTAIHGLETNLLYLRQVATDAGFTGGHYTTAHLAGIEYRAPTIEVIKPGTQTTIQDYPGRVGYWDIGVPPSGPMDMLAFRQANRLVGNPEDVAGLELTVNGPTLKFNTDATIALAGAAMAATLDDQPVAFWEPVAVRRGQTLKIGAVEGTGARAYLAFRGGLDVPRHMGSRSTFTLGQMGGHGGRVLWPGDVLHVGQQTEGAPAAMPADSVPTYGNAWEVRTIYGPHGAPDFFTDNDIEMFFGTDWEVHYNSSRTGVRLIGPKPEWAREDGGEAGLHPSNIHDNAYAIGTIDFTGDMPVILGPDGPSLGGFVCPATIVTADLWKLGQFKPGDTIRFVPTTLEEANRLEREQTEAVARLEPAECEAEPAPITTPVIRQRRADKGEHAVGVTYRPAGDKYLLVEYGPIVLDLSLRFRVQALLEWLNEQGIDGIVEMTPGVRSLQIHYEPRALSTERLLTILEQAESELKSLEDVELPSRIIHLPLAWDDSQTQLATEKYMQSVRKDAPWCPRNIEFIRRINGLKSEEEVKRIVYDASYLVMGLGDVYLSAPLATPVDPRHRLVTTKYNPARTWTPENAVGIGGSYMCIYGMEGPGGYQFVGRTLPIWNRYKQTREFQQPWLLRFFDQIRYYEVSEDELLKMRDAFPHGGIELEIEETTFSLGRYNRFIEENAEEIRAFKERQQAAFEAERQHWIATGQANYESESEPVDTGIDTIELGEGQTAIAEHVHGVVWKLEVDEGDRVEAGQTLMVLESMKMEIQVDSETAGTVASVLCKEGDQVKPGQTLIVLDDAE